MLTILTVFCNTCQYQISRTSCCDSHGLITLSSWVKPAHSVQWHRMIFLYKKKNTSHMPDPGTWIRKEFLKKFRGIIWILFFVLLSKNISIASISCLGYIASDNSFWSEHFNKERNGNISFIINIYNNIWVNDYPITTSFLM